MEPVGGHPFPDADAPPVRAAPLPPPDAVTVPPFDPSPDPLSVAGGGLTALWRILLGVTWLAAFFAYAAVWQASVQLGIGTWWIGPRAQPTPALLRLAPFIVCLAVVICVLYGVRRLSTIAAIASLVLLAGAIPDFSRSTSLAVTESIIGALLLAVSVLARSGRLVR